MIVRAWQAMRAVADVVLISNDAASDDWLPVRRRADGVRDVGPLGGIVTALDWAAEESRPGALVLGCDMPFIDPEVLRLLLTWARTASPSVDAVVPASKGPLGFEPLCAYYSVRSAASIRARITSGDYGVGRLSGVLDMLCVPLDEVRRIGPPERLFFNVNSLADHERAERLAATTGRDARVHPSDDGSE